ncbi:MAG: hypothetical protein Q4C68_08450 [Moraxella sp.]|nr:hypothetical protein [Moraxella sp.]
MDWLKDFVKNLPLEGISEILAKIVFLWIRLVDGVPESELPFLVYVGASIVVLILLFFLLRIFPKFIRDVIIVLFIAVLFTPAGTMGDAGGSAPAIIGVAHHVLMGDFVKALSGFLPILSVAIILFIAAALWQMIWAAVLDAQAERE